MQARYAELAQLLVSDISQGKIAVGSNLPSELDLAKQYKVSRTTVRSALSVIEGLGLISRRRRAGTRVEAVQPPKTYARSLSHLEDLVQYATETARQVRSISHVVCDETLAAELECRPGQRWMHIEMLRVEPGAPEAPICWTDVYLEPSVGEAIRDQVHESSGLICDLAERAAGRFVTNVEQTIRALEVPAPLAETLHVPTGSAALAITRRYLDQNGAAFQITLSIHPGSRFSYRLSLRHTLGDPQAS